MDRDEGFLERLIGDGRPLLILTALTLMGCGAFALFQAATGHFLPHDTEYLGMTAQQLCTLRGCRIVHFMMHDRVSFGGVLLAIGIMYLWLTEFPLRRGQSWAWWAIVASGGAGFLSFLAYLGYGYLDTWHGWATLALLPVFVAGLALTAGVAGPLPLLRGAFPNGLRDRLAVGRALLAFTAAGMMMAGLTIMVVGMTSVFVPQDLAFMGLAVADLDDLSTKLVPLIAHDRSGFGGGLFSGGIAILFLALFGVRRREPVLWATLALAGSVGFGCAIAMHFVVGYTSFSHLLPAYLGALVFVAGIVALRPEMAASR
jgi:MFS family permease